MSKINFVVQVLVPYGAMAFAVSKFVIQGTHEKKEEFARLCPTDNYPVERHDAYLVPQPHTTFHHAVLS